MTSLFPSMQTPWADLFLSVWSISLCCVTLGIYLRCLINLSSLCNLRDNLASLSGDLQVSVSFHWLRGSLRRQLQVETTQLHQVGWVQVCVNKDQDYLLGTVSFGEVGICSEMKEVAGKAGFPNHEVVRQIAIFWLLCGGVVSGEYSETL